MVSLSVMEAAELRFSPRIFANRSVDDALLVSLLEAAGGAPSSMNEQPWRWLYAHRKETHRYDALFSCLNEGNQAWAGTAPVLMAICASTLFTRNKRLNHHALYDAGQAAGHLSLLLAGSELYMRQMGGFDRNRALNTLELPENVEPVVFAAIGYVPEDLKRPERIRNQVDTMIIRNGIK